MPLWYKWLIYYSSNFHQTSNGLPTDFKIKERKVRWKIGDYKKRRVGQRIKKKRREEKKIKEKRREAKRS